MAVALSATHLGCGGARAADASAREAPSATSASASSSSPAVSPAQALAPVPLPSGALRRLGTPHFRQAASVTVMDVSRDGRFVVAGAADDQIVVWRTSDGGEVYRAKLRGAPYGIRGAAFDARGTRLFVAGTGAVSIVSTSTWSELRELGACKGEGLSSFAISPDDRTLAVACGEGLVLVPVEGGSPTLVPGLARATKLSWSADGRHLAAAGDRDIAIVDVAARAVALRISAEHMSSGAMAFAPTGTVLAYVDGRYGRGVRLHDVVARAEVGSFEDEGMLGDVAWSPSGRQLAFVRGQLPSTVIVVDVASKSRRVLHPPVEALRRLGWRSPGELWMAHDHAVRAWDVVRDVETRGPVGHHGAIHALAWSADGAVITTGSEDCTLRRWDLASGDSRGLESPKHPQTNLEILADRDPIASRRKGPVRGVDFAADGAWISIDGAVSGSTFRRWSPDGRTHTAAVRLFNNGVVAMTLSPDRRTAYVLGRDDGDTSFPHDASERQETLRWVDTATGATRRSQRVEDQGDPIDRWLSLSGDGRRLAVSTHDGTLVLDAATGAKIATLTETVVASALSRDGTFAVIGVGNLLQAVKVGRDDPLGSEWLYEDGEKISVLAYAPDDRTIVAGSDRGAVSVIFDPSDPTAAHHLRGHRGAVRAIAFSPDRSSFATASDDGQVLVWALPPKP